MLTVNHQTAYTDSFHLLIKLARIKELINEHDIVGLPWSPLLNQFQVIMWKTELEEFILLHLYIGGP
jgi:hypothetical protein